MPSKGSQFTDIGEDLTVEWDPHKGLTIFKISEDGNRPGCMETILLSSQEARKLHRFILANLTKR
jgi:hypothetical protein